MTNCVLTVRNLTNKAIDKEIISTQGNIPTASKNTTVVARKSVMKPYEFVFS